MDVQEVLRSLGLILGAGLCAGPIALLLRVPQMIVLVAIGALIGPSALEIVDNPLSGLGAQLIFTVGVSIILFHGGTEISLRVLSGTAVGLGLLVLPGVLLSAVLVAVVVAPLFNVGFDVALLIGAVLAATDPAILIPLFARIRLRPKVAQTVIAESAFNDPTATVLALTFAAIVQSGHVSLGGPLGDFTKSLLLGTVFGLVAGVAIAAFMSSNRAGIWRESPAAVVVTVIALGYFSVDNLGGSGYLAAFVIGLIVGNMEMLGLGRHDRDAIRMEGFVSQMSEISVLAVFVTLGMNLPFAQLGDHLVRGLLVVFFFMFVVRPLVVLACLLPDRRGGWTPGEIVFLAWCRETGVVPAAVASLLLARHVAGAEIAVSLVAIAVCATLLVQATTAAWLARRLGLLDEAPIPLPVPSS
jgi:cell volume regulation protein A